MPIRVSSTAFFRYLAAQSTTRVSKVREAKKMVMTPAEDYKRVDYWKTLREESIRFLTGSSNSREFSTAIEGVTDEKKVSNYKASAAGLRRWLGRKRVTAQAVQSVIWSHAGLEVVVAPELILSWPGGGPYVVKLYFSADPLSKYLANPMLRLLEQTHGRLGIAAILDTQQSKLYTGPTARPTDLDLLLSTEAASYVSMWNSV